MFRPGPIKPGNYSFSIATAGSTTLVLQTVLPALLLAEGESNLTLEGGTHNPFAPPFDFLAKSYLPLVNRLGPTVEAKLVRPGFYPAGGGQFTLRIQPAKRLGPLELTDARRDRKPPSAGADRQFTPTHRRARVPNHRRRYGLGSSRHWPLKKSKDRAGREMW